MADGFRRPVGGRTVPRLRTPEAAGFYPPFFPAVSLFLNLRAPLKIGFRRLFAFEQSPIGKFFGGYVQLEIPLNKRFLRDIRHTISDGCGLMFSSFGDIPASQKSGKIREKAEKNLKKTGNGCIVNDSDVVYPEYDVRKALESGSSGAPFSLLLLRQTELNKEQS